MLSIWPRAQPNDSKHTWDAAINKISREQCMLAFFRLVAAGFYLSHRILFPNRLSLRFASLEGNDFARSSSNF